MPYKRRRRSLSVKIPDGSRAIFYDWPYPDTPHVNSVNPVPGRTYEGSQVTDSKGNPWGSRKVTAFSDIGGDFYTRKQYFVPSGNRVTLEARNGFWPSPDAYTAVYKGPLYACDPGIGGQLPNPTSGALTSLDTYGATAVARCKPTNSVADAAVTLGEFLSGGVPSAAVRSWSERANRARDAGSDYLNLEFGWKPLVSEIQNFAKASAFAEQIMTQYERDAGRIVRRGFRFPPTKTSSLNFAAARSPIPMPGSDFFVGGLASSGTVVQTEVSVERWFSGAFTYHLPSDYVQRKMMAEYALRAQVLFGLDLSPETLWNLAPWSWAVDWFTNTGDVISNLSDWSKDGLVMRYGYVMEHTISKTTTTQTTNRLKQPAVVSPTIIVDETKKRRRANPFGFGLTWEGLTPRQLTIAAALGISKS